MNLVVVFRKPAVVVAAGTSAKRVVRKRARRTAVVRYLNVPVHTTAH